MTKAGMVTVDMPAVAYVYTHDSIARDTVEAVELAAKYPHDQAVVAAWESLARRTLSDDEKEALMELYRAQHLQATGRA